MECRRAQRRKKRKRAAATAAIAAVVDVSFDLRTGETKERWAEAIRAETRGARPQTV